MNQQTLSRQNRTPGQAGGGVRNGAVATLAAGVTAAAMLFGCDGAPRKAREVEPVVRDVPMVLRGQLGSEASLRGVDPILVSGYGLVVGLNGTGGGPLPVQIQATMERELARGGVGKGGPLDAGPLAGRSPRQVLRDPNVAVVVVEGVIAPGSPKGSTFDVRVRALANNATSLEGGLLWTTELRLGYATPFTRMRTRRIAEARGPIFLNPFADPSGEGRVVMTADTDEVPVPPPAPESAAGEGGIPAPAGDAIPEPRAEGAEPTSAAAGGAGDIPPPAAAANPPAGGASSVGGGGSIFGDAAAVPSAAPTGAKTPAQPIEPAAAATPVLQGDGVTRTIGRVLAGGLVTDPFQLEIVLDNPSHARAASVQAAINNRFPPSAGDEGQTARGRNNMSIAVTVPKNYTEKPEEFVTLLRFLQIDQSFPQEYAKRYADALRQQPALAEELSWSLRSLGRPAVSFLVPLYEHAEFVPRQAALRAGAKLGDPRSAPFLIQMARRGATTMRTEAVELLGSLPPSPQVSAALRQLADDKELEVRVAAYEAMDARNDPTIERIDLDGKFTLHVVPASDELIYVTQQGKPRIVLFGSGMSLRFPMVASAWSERLIVKHEGSQPRVFYRDYRSGRIVQGPAPAKVRDLVRFLAHRTTPENPDPGLDLTYSEVVGALYEIQRQGGTDAAFATERERLLARLMEAQDVAMVEERPESGDRPVRPAEEEQLKPVPKKQAGPPAPMTKRSLVVPLSPKKAVKKEEGKGE